MTTGNVMRKSPLAHHVPVIRIKLFIARLLYYFLKIFYHKNQRVIRRNAINFRIDLSEGIDLAIFLFGTFQRRVTDSPYLVLPDDAIVFDIGANIGAMSLRFAQRYPNGHIYAFEPAETAYNRLLDNLALNPLLSRRITPFCLFMTDEEHKKEPQQSYSSWKIDGARQRQHPVHGGLVQTITPDRNTSIDEFCLSNSISRVNLIKVDTDGSELNVLRGGIEIIKSCKPYIIFEISLTLIKEHENTFDSYYKFLSAMGYTLINSRNGKVVSTANFHRQIPLYYTTDIVAIPPKVTN